ncbi:hypothetical protein ACET3Z_000855 [Daucus carota]
MQLKTGKLNKKVRESCTLLFWVFISLSEMDFHDMKRRELQKLCKEHNIPANLSNSDMAEKLSSMFKVQENVEERPMRKTRSCLKNSDEMLSENESDVLKRKSKKVRFSPQNDVFQLGGKNGRASVVDNEGGASQLIRCRAKLAKTIMISPVVKKRGKRAVQEVEEEDVVENKGDTSRVTRTRASLGKSVVISSPVVMKKRGKRALHENEKRDLAVENIGGASRVTRATALLGEKVLTSPVVMKKRVKKAVQEDEKEDLLVENKGAASRVTRARASNQVLISSPVVIKRKGKKIMQEDEKEDLVVDNKGAPSRVTRARAGKQVLISSPVAMKKRGKKAVQKDEKEDLVLENKDAPSRVTRARAGKQVLISSPVAMKKRGKKAVQKDEKEDLVLENKDAPSRVTRARAGKQVLISSPVAMKKRGKKAVQKEKKCGSTLSVVVDFTDLAVKEEKEVITVKFLRSRKVENVVSPKNLTRKRNTQNKSEGVNVEVSENKDAEEGITQTRRSKRNRMELTQVEPLEENLDGTVNAGRRNITRSRNQFQAKAPNVVRESETRDAREEAKKVVVQVKEPLRRSGRHVNTAGDVEMPIRSDKSTWDQTRHGTKRKSVMPQMKKAKIEKPVAGNLGMKNNDPLNESTKPIVIEKGSETGHIRRSKRNASGDGSISENANGSGTDIKTCTTKKQKRDAVPEEVPSQHTGRRVNRKADNISDKIEGKTPIASEPRTRSGNRQNSQMPSARKLNMSGNWRPNRTTGEKASPRHTRELSLVPKHSATGVKQSKIVSETPGARSGSGKKSFDHTAKKLIVSGNTELHKSVRDKEESPHQSRDISLVPRRSETELKLRGSRSKQTPVISEHPRRFTRSALKGKTDGQARVRGKIYQKKSQSVSKLPLSKLESSLPKVISASEGLDVDVQFQSSNPEVDRRTNNLAANASDFPEDKAACSTPQGGSAKTHSMDLNLQESEGPEMINIEGISSSDALKLRSGHAELEVDVSAREQAHSPGERPASHDVHSSIPQIAGCSSDPLFDTSNSCGGLDSYAILQDSATEGNDKAPVHIEPAEGLHVSGDVAFIDRNSVDDGFASLEQIKSKGMEVNPQQVKHVEPSSEGITNVVLEGSTVHEEQSMNQFLFPEDGCSTISLSQTGDVDEDNTNATQPKNSSESNVASPHLAHLKTDDAGDEESPQLRKDVESIFKGIDLNIVFQGSAVHEDEPVNLSPLAEVAEITDNPVTANSDTACVTRQEGLTEIDAKSLWPEITEHPVTANSDSACLTQQEGPPEIIAKSSPLVQIESVDNADIIGDVGVINAGTVFDNLFNVEQINSSAIKEKLEVSNYVNSVVADGSTVNEEKLTAEVSDCGPTGQELGICIHPAEFAESGELDKDSRSSYEELGEASYAYLNNQTVSMIFTEEKDDTRHLEISEQADELHNRSSELGSQENVLVCARDESEISEMVNMLDSTTRELSNMPEYISSQTSDHNNGGKCKENNLSSSSITLMTSEGQEFKSVIIGGREVEETVFEDIKENESKRTSSTGERTSSTGDAHKTLDVEGEPDLQNISSERTPVISEDDINRDGIACPLIVQKFPSSADDHCHTPSDDSCGKEQDTDMSMVKSSRNFGKEFFSEHDICRPLKASCGKEQGTPMSIVKSSKNCVEGFSSQHDNVIEHVNVCCADTLPQAICEDFAGCDNQMVTDLMGSTGRGISRTGALNNEKLEETDMNDGETDNNGKGICQENDESSILVQMDVDTNNVESSRDNLQGCDQEVDASEMLKKELQSYDDAMHSDALLNLQYGGERVTSEQTSEAPGVRIEELPVEDANAPVSLQYGHGETNEDQEHKSRSDKMVQEDLPLWYEDTSFIPEKSEVAEKEVDIFIASMTEEQLHNSGEEHSREKGPESIENEHDDITVEFSVNTPGESNSKSETNRDAHQKVDCRHDNKFGDDLTRNGS